MKRINLVKDMILYSFDSLITEIYASKKGTQQQLNRIHDLKQKVNELFDMIFKKEKRK